MAAILGGTEHAGRCFRDLRKIFAAAQGRSVGASEYGLVLADALHVAPFTGDQVSEFDRGYYITREVLYGALLLAGSIWRPR